MRVVVCFMVYIIKLKKIKHKHQKHSFEQRVNMANKNYFFKERRKITIFQIFLSYDNTIKLFEENIFLQHTFQVEEEVGANK